MNRYLAAVLRMEATRLEFEGEGFVSQVCCQGGGE